MMLEKHQLDNDFINLEIARIEIFFKKNNYDLEQKRMYIELKLDEARKTNNKELLFVTNKLLDDIKKESLQ